MSGWRPDELRLAICKQDGTASTHFTVANAECSICHRQPRFVRRGERVEFACQLYCGATIVVDSYEPGEINARGLYCPGCLPR